VFISLGIGDISPLKLPNFINLGWQENPHNIINAGDVLMLPNRYTYFDLIVIETMAIGKPLIVSATGGNIDLADRSSGVILCKNNSPEEYLTIIRRLSNKPEYLRGIGKENKKMYDELFSPYQFVKEYINQFIFIKSEEIKL